MAREWVLDAHRRTMEEMLIEVYGCMPLRSTVVRMQGAAAAKKIESDIYPDATEKMLIEAFGCVSLGERVLWLEGGRDRKKAKVEAPVVLRDAESLAVGIA